MLGALQATISRGAEASLEETRQPRPRTRRGVRGARKNRGAPAVSGRPLGPTPWARDREDGAPAGRYYGSVSAPQEASPDPTTVHVEAFAALHAFELPAAPGGSKKRP